MLSGIFLHENILTITNLLALLLVCTGIGVVNYQRQNRKTTIQGGKENAVH